MTIIFFTKTKLPYGWCGNMSPFPIYHDNRAWRTSEALFQALRFEGYSDIQEKIRAEASPMYAKRTAQLYRSLLIEDGYQFQGEQDMANMSLCLDLKLAQNPMLQTLLWHTGDAIIIEDVSARPEGSNLFWGAVLTRDSDSQRIQNWRGENALGKLWMKKRETLPEVRQPADLFG